MASAPRMAVCRLPAVWRIPTHGQLAQRDHRRRGALLELGLAPPVVPLVDLHQGVEVGEALADHRVGVDARRRGPGRRATRRGPGQGRSSSADRAGPPSEPVGSAALVLAHHGPLVGEGGLQHPPPVVHGPQHVGVGDPGVGEEHLVEAGVTGGLAQGPDLDAGLLHREPEERNALVLGGVEVGAGDEQGVLGLAGARRPHLLAVDDPLVAVALGPGLDAGQVGACPRFGVEQAHVEGAEHERAQEAVGQLVAPEGEQRVGPQVVAVLGRAARPHPAQLVDDDVGQRRVEAPPVVLDGPAGRRPPRVDEALGPHASGQRAGPSARRARPGPRPARRWRRWRGRRSRRQR